MSKAAELAALISSQSALSNRNLIINGAMQVAQRGTSSTGTAYNTVDRYKINFDQVSVTTSQETLTSGSPYNDGFRNFLRLSNTSVSTSTSAYVQFKQVIEAQNIANSGWQYASSDSSISLSFWARSSLAGTYYFSYRSYDSAQYIRNVAFTLEADTWKKVSVSVAGNSNLVFDNDSAAGLDVLIVPHYGTGYTGGGEVSTTDWYSRASQSDAYFPDYAQSWSNSASATFDVTGIQLEVGEQATPFEHRSFGDELARCQRYYQRTEAATSGYANLCVVTNISGSSGTDQRGVIPFTTNMRTNPSLSTSGSLALLNIGGGLSSISAGDGLATHSAGIRVNSNSNMSSGQSGLLRQNNDTTAHLQFDAEL